MESSSTSLFRLLRKFLRSKESKSPISSLVQLLRKFRRLTELGSGKYNDALLQEIFEEKLAKDVDKDTQLFLSVPEWEIRCAVDERVFGRFIEKNEILSILVENKKYESFRDVTIAIFGIGGRGKTALARLVYDDEELQHHFELRAWVKVAGQEFVLQHVAREILKSATGTSYRVDDLKELDVMIRDVVQSKRCLIVFDEIESITMDSWLYMELSWFRVVGLGSKVLITTSNEKVANLVSRKPYPLFGLKKVDVLSILRYSGLYHINKKEAKRLVHLCQGTPLIVKLVGSLIKYDKNLASILLSREFFREGGMSFLDVSVVILLSIWALPRHLMHCLFFCASISQHYLINKEKLIQLWIANGLVKPQPWSNSLEDSAHAYFNQLMCRSFFTDIICNEYGDTVEFRIPGVILRFTQDIARIIFRDMVAFVNAFVDDNDGRLKISLALRGKYRPENLRTLILSSTISLGGRLSQSIFEFKNLQSLDLSCTDIKNLSNEISLLKDLSYLNLSYTLVEKLPDSIPDLLQLRTLNLSGCYHLKVLPDRMRKLINLRHLNLWLCDSLSHLPSGICLLKSLNSMPLFVLGLEHDSARLGELNGLHQLSGRLDIKNLENVKDIKEAKEAELFSKDLIHLGLSWSEPRGHHFELLEILEPKLKLKVLDLAGYMGEYFPRWISSMFSLIKIYIKDCGCKELPSLGQLPFLKELQIRGMVNVEQIGPKFYGEVSDIFPSLEQLGLYSMPQLREWSNATMSSGRLLFPRLKTLTVEGCPQLQCLPPFANVEELIFWNSNSKILSSLHTNWSISSLLINDVNVGELHLFPETLHTLKKLIILRCKDLLNLLDYGYAFQSVQHLDILHCHELYSFDSFDFPSLRTLCIVDCPILLHVGGFKRSEFLVELVFEDCPAISFLLPQHPLRKLIMKRCRKIYVPPKHFKQLQDLQYLWISGCPKLEKELFEDPSHISHVPCVILGNYKLRPTDYQSLSHHTEPNPPTITVDEPDLMTYETLRGYSSVTAGVEVLKISAVHSWERLVGAVLRKEALSQLLLKQSLISSCSSSEFDFFYGEDTQFPTDDEPSYKTPETQKAIVPTTGTSVSAEVVMEMNVYDNWERLVDAVLHREELRLLALAHSRSTSFGSSCSDSDYNFLKQVPSFEDDDSKVGLESASPSNRPQTVISAPPSDWRLAVDTGD